MCVCDYGDYFYDAQYDDDRPDYFVMFFSHFMLFQTFLKKNLGIQTNYFSFNVYFVFFCTLEILKKCPFTYSYWLNGRWFLQIVDIGHFIMRLEILKSAPSLIG